VRNSHHFGAAGYYARLAAAQGLVALITSSACTVLMVPTRGTVPLLGSNPIAFAAPMAGGAPFVLDMATSTVATNKVKVYELNNKPVPAGWVADEQGAPVTDAAEAMDVIFRRPGGGITPLGGAEVTGGHKGYGLGLMVQVLSATLTGAAFAPLRAARAARRSPTTSAISFWPSTPAPYGRMAASRKTWPPWRRRCGAPPPPTQPARCCCPGTRRKPSTPAAHRKAFRSRLRWTGSCTPSVIVAVPNTCFGRHNAARTPPGEDSNQ
jgi:hypothetical protein